MLSCVVALVVAAFTDVHAQQVRGGVFLVGGSATDVLGVTSRALTLAPSVAFSPDPRVAFSLDGSGTKFDNGQWSLGASTAAATRLSVGHIAAFTLNAGASLTGTSYDFSYVTATALPALEVNVGAFGVFAGVRGSHAASRLTRTTQGPGGLFGAPSLQQSVINVSRDARAVVYGATTRFAGTSGETMTLGAREERGVIDTVSTIDRTASIAVLRGRLTLGGSLGIRDESGTHSTFGSGSLSVAVTPVVSLEINAGAYPANRLVGTSSGRFTNVGLSLTTGRSTSRAAAPIPHGVPAPAAGVTRLTLRDLGARRVEVAGDFTNWKSIAAARASNGVWFVDLRIPPGSYRYAFRIDGTTWKVPDGATVADDDYGGTTAWLFISAPSGTTR